MAGGVRKGDFDNIIKIETLLYEDAEQIAPKDDILQAIQILVPLFENNKELYGPLLAKALILNDEPQKAIAVCEEMLPGSGEECGGDRRLYYLWMAAAYAELGDRQKMMEHLLSAWRLDNDIIEIVKLQKEFFPFMNEIEELRLGNKSGK